MRPLEIAVAVCRTGEQEEEVRRLVEPVARGRARLRFSRDKAGLEALLPEAEVLYGEKLTPEMLAAAPRLKWAHVNVAGVERSMSPELAASDVVFTNSRAMHKAYVAEHAVGLMLAFAKRLHVSWAAQAGRRWAYEEISTTNFSLAGKVCVVLGLGAIGLEIARLASAFGMRCWGTKRRLEPVAPPEWLERVSDESGTDALLAEADFVVVALPLTARTRGFLSRDRLAKMRTGAYLVNIARGAIVDEDAMVEALREGRLAGAGLDVFAREPLAPESPLWGMPDVIVTPHVSGNYPEYNAQAARLFAENLGRFLEGRELVNVVDKAEGY